MRLKSPKHYIYHYKILIFYLKKLINRDLEAYHDKIYDEDIANDNSEINSENDEQIEHEESNDEYSDSKVIDEEADLETLTNNN